MGKCSVLGCREKEEKGKHFYRFPADKVRRQIWVQFTRRLDWINHEQTGMHPTNRSLICEKHFEAHHLKITNKRSIPRPDSYPTKYYKLDDEDSEYIIVPFPYEERLIPDDYKAPQECPIDERTKRQEEKERKRRQIDENKEKKQYHKELFSRKQKLEALKQICRFCAESKDLTIKLENFVTWDMDLQNIYASLEMNNDYADFMSQIVCEDCYNQIYAFCLFKSNCLEAEVKVLQRLEALEEDINFIPRSSQIPTHFLKEDSKNTSQPIITSDHARDDEVYELCELENQDINMLDDVIEEGFLVDDQSECDLKSEQADIEQYVIEYDTHRIVEIKDIQTETTAIKEILDIKDDLRMHELETLDEVEYVDDPDFVPDEINEENREFEAENMDGNKSKVIVKDNKLLKLFECVFCKVKFGGKKKFSAHICQFKTVSCQFCKKKFTKAKSFRSHMAHMHGTGKNKRYKCPMCKITVVGTELSLKEHRKSCHKKDDPITCELCLKVFTNLGGYTMHMKFHEEKRKKMPADEQTSFICEVCGKSFAKKMYLRVHNKEKHLEADLVFQCELCQKVLPHRNAYHKHKDHVHKFIESPCDVCGKVFRNKALLRKHKIYHDESKRVHNCTICGKMYFTNVALKRHQIGHTDQRPYSCDLCDMAYTRNEQLKIHKERAHANNEEVLYTITTY